jgi:hypothetical protein
VTEVIIGFLLYYQALIREVINGVAFVLFATLTLMITVFLWDTWVRVRPVTIPEWQALDGVSTACVLWWIFGAEAYRTFNVWLAYNIGRSNATVGVGVFSASSVNSVIYYLAAGVVLNLALLFAIYRFTPPDWRPRIWFYAASGAVIFVSAPAIIDYFT